jgi:hypothetical protein
MRRALLLTMSVSSALLLVAVPGACAQALRPWWHVTSSARPSNIQPGVGGDLVVTVENVGETLAYARRSPVRIVDVLPKGLRATGETAISELSDFAGQVPCSPEAGGARVSCTFAGGESELARLGDEEGAPEPKANNKVGGLVPYRQIEVRIGVETRAGTATCERFSLAACEENEVSVSGGEGAVCVQAESAGADSFTDSRCTKEGAGDYRLQFTGAVNPTTARRPVLVNSQAPAFGLQTYEFTPEEAGGLPDAQAGSHPFETGFDLIFSQDGEEGEGPEGQPAAQAVASAKDLRVKLPPGFVGNPSGIPQCPLGEFLRLVPGPRTSLQVDGCPADAAVGVITIAYQIPGSLGAKIETFPFFNLEPQVGEPARFGFFIPPVHQGSFIDTALRSGGNYGVTSITPDISQEVSVLAAHVTLWGVPGDPSHDPVRGWSCLEASQGYTEKDVIEETGGTCRGLGAIHPPPFLDLPTSCTGPLRTSVEADSWQDQGVFGSFGSEPVTGLDGCNQLQFEPEIKVTPDGTEASKPTGLNVDVHVSQEGQLNGEGLAQSNIKDIEVTLPDGVTLDPSAADGLQACTGNTGQRPGAGHLGSPGDQIGYEGTGELEGEPGVSAPTFTPYRPGSVDAKTNGYGEPLEPGVDFCPDAAKVATVKIETPLLPNPLEGAVYLASPQNFHVFPAENPFGTHVAMYIVAEDPVSGSLVKLPGRVELGGEPGASGELAPGQIRSFFEDNPQLPFEDAEVHFFGGERAPLATPDHCGTYTSQAIYTPWDGGAQVHGSSSFQITSGPNGSPCPGASLPFSPELHSSVSDIDAGGFTPLSTTLSRPSGDQDIASVTLHYPPGLSGSLTGVELCPEPRADQGTCGPNSLIGETIVSVGVGGEPFTVTGGRAYLTGPYEGAPFGLSIVNPAKAGPFDLQEGRPVIVRAKVEVDPRTAALTVVTNPYGTPGSIPTIVEGFPLQIQHVNVLINRPGFTFNPTNCERMEVTGTIQSADGASAPVSEPFQVTNCAALKFEPKVSVSTSGKTSKADGASLTYRVAYPNAAIGTYANIKKVKVELPKQLPSRLTTLQKACTQAQFQANPAGCPAASAIGHARAVVPNIPVPVEGPVYFVSNGGEAFPNLVMVLQGYGVKIELVGDTYISKAGITSTTFNAIPDNPVDNFEITLPEGPYSALAANGNLCKQHLTMANEYIAQNGAEIHTDVPVTTAGCKPTIYVTSHTVKNGVATLKVKVPSAGRLLADGKGLSRASGKAGGAGTVTVKLHLTKSEAAFLRGHRGRRLKAKIELTFTPKRGRQLAASVTVPIG